jgi:Fusaric acid resistance protein-like
VSESGAKKSVIRKARAPIIGFGLLVVLLLPGVLVALFVVSGAASVMLFGALPVVAAYFGGATHSTTRIVTFTVIVGTLARLFDQAPIPSALLMAVTALIIGMTERRGHSSPILLVGIALTFLIISPPALGQTGHQALDNLDPVLVTAVLLLIGGLWARLVIAGIHKWIPNTPESKSRNPKELIPYALALSVSTGLATYFLLLYAPNGVGAWLVLTIFVVLQSDRKNTLHKTRDRLIGTIGGAVVALIMIELLRYFNFERGLGQLVLALAFLGASMSYFARGPYWKYVFYLTPGVVLLDSNTVANQDSVVEWRVGFTLIGVAIALLVGLIVREISQALIARGKFTPDQSH